jgi:hypothetical protein
MGCYPGTTAIPISVWGFLRELQAALKKRSVNKGCGGYISVTACVIIRNSLRGQRHEFLSRNLGECGG